MTESDFVRAIEDGLASLGGERWAVARLPDGRSVIRVSTDEGSCYTLRLTRERQPAGDGDVHFVGNALRDLHRLLEAAKGGANLDETELDEIEARVLNASPGPWRAFLTSKGGLGGDSVISVTKNDPEPDLYLWLNDAPAPDRYYAFVGAARQDLPRLLSAVRSLGI